MTEANAAKKAAGEVIVIQVTSAGFVGGNTAKISVNSREVKCKQNENGTDRGFHIVVIRPSDGRVVSAKVFDTYKTSDAFDEFIKTGVKQGHIVVAACKDECIINLSHYGRQWFADMGSREIWDL